MKEGAGESKRKGKEEEANQGILSRTSRVQSKMTDRFVKHSFYSFFFFLRKYMPILNKFDNSSIEKNISL